MPPRGHSTNWVFTINNPSDSCNPLQWPGVRFLIYQKEQGEKGTKHLQGYVQFEKQKQLVSVKKVHSTAHWEVRQGTHEEAVAYCTKKDTRIGSPIRKGVPRVVSKPKNAKVLVRKNKICKLILWTNRNRKVTALIWLRYMR